MIKASPDEKKPFMIMKLIWHWCVHFVQRLLLILHLGNIYWDL